MCSLIRQASEQDSVRSGVLASSMYFFLPYQLTFGKYWRLFVAPFADARAGTKVRRRGRRRGRERIRKQLGRAAAAATLVSFSSFLVLSTHSNTREERHLRCQQQND